MIILLLNLTPTIIHAQRSTTSRDDQLNPLAVQAMVNRSEQKLLIADFDTSLLYAREAISIAEKVNRPEVKSIAFIALGKVLYQQRKLQEAATAFSSALKQDGLCSCDPQTATSKSYIGSIQGMLGDAETGKRNCLEALSFFEQSKDVKGEIVSSIHLGYLLRNTGQLDEALICFESAQLLSQRSYDEWNAAASCMAAGTVFGIRGEYDIAHDAFQRALSSWVHVQNKQGIADVYHNIGNVYFNRGDLAEALQYYLYALETRKTLGDQLKIGESYLDIGHIYLEQNQYDQALLNYHSALNLFTFIGHQQRIAQAHYSLGGVYNTQGLFKEALSHYQNSLDQQLQLQDLSGMLYTYNNLGRLYTHTGDFIGAGKMLDKARELSLQLGDINSEALCNYHYGNMLLKMKRYAEALNAFEKVIARSKHTRNKNLLMYGYEGMAVADSALGRLPEAMTHLRQQKIYGDSLVSEEKEKALVSMQMRYETEKKDHEIDSLRAAYVIQQLTIKRQREFRNYLWAGIILVLVTSVILYRYYRTRQQLKLQQLRNKIASDLHDDVGSTLSSIAIFSEIAQAQMKDVNPHLQTIRESSRKMLDAMGDIVWSIHPQNDQFEKIILRMRSYAFELLGAKQIEFDFKADEYLDSLRLPMQVRKNLYLIFKEAINNMVKYADASKALFVISGNQHRLSMSIRDNGKGFSSGEAYAGNGLNNMIRRAKEIGGELDIESSPGQGTSIQFSVLL